MSEEKLQAALKKAEARKAALAATGGSSSLVQSTLEGVLTRTSKRRNETTPISKAKRQDTGKNKEAAGTECNDSDDVEVVEQDRPWGYAVNLLEKEFSKMHLAAQKQARTISSMQAKVSEATSLKKETERLKKELAEAEGKVKAAQEAKEEAEHKLDLELATTKSLREQVEAKEQEVEDLEIEVAQQHSEGFDKAVAQVKVLHPSLDLSALSVYKVVRDGQLVDSSTRADLVAPEGQEDLVEGAESPNATA